MLADYLTYLITSARCVPSFSIALALSLSSSFTFCLAICPKNNKAVSTYKDICRHLVTTNIVYTYLGISCM